MDRAAGCVVRWPRTRTTQLVGLLLAACLLLLAITVAPASAAGIVEDFPRECQAPCTVTFKYQPEPGVTHDLSWDADYFAEFQETHRTQCAGDAGQPRCQVTVTYNQPKDYFVAVRSGGSPYASGTAQLKVLGPDDAPKPLYLEAPDELALPDDHLAIYTPRRNLLVDWRSGSQQGEGYVVRTTDTPAGGRKHVVRIDAPAGTLALKIRAYDDPTKEGEVLDATREVRTYRPTNYQARGYGAKALLLRKGLVVKSSQRVFTREPGRWRQRFSLQRRDSGRWRTFKSGQSGGRLRMSWLTNTYSGRMVVPRSMVRRLGLCARRARLRAVVRFGLYAGAERKVASKRLNVRVRGRAC